MSPDSTKTKLILALDVATLDEAKLMLNHAGPKLKWVKVGLQLFTRYGPDIVKSITDLGYQVFLDLKLHDIPNQVANAIKSLKDLPIGMLTLHAAGGEEMMRWANEARQEINHPMKLLAITVLTSMDQPGLNAIGVEGTPKNQVSRLANLVIKSGLQGIVCSPLELPMLRDQLGNDPLLVTPGIRPTGSDANEQKRIMTPSEAATLGASYIVVGRPIYKSNDPAQAVETILNELETSKTHA